MFTNTVFTEVAFVASEIDNECSEFFDSRGGGTGNYSIDDNSVLVYEVGYDNIEGGIVEGIVGVGEISVMGNELTIVNSALGETLEGEDVFVRVFTRIVE